jgi:hypothetical protein
MWKPVPQCGVANASSRKWFKTLKVKFLVSDVHKFSSYNARNTLHLRQITVISATRPVIYPRCYTSGDISPTLHVWWYIPAATRLVVYPRWYTSGDISSPLHVWWYIPAATRLVIYPRRYTSGDISPPLHVWWYILAAKRLVIYSRRYTSGGISPPLHVWWYIPWRAFDGKLLGTHVKSGGYGEKKNLVFFLEL